MSRPSRQFKDTQVFDWDMEPKDERPSEFVQSTGYSSLSGYYTMPDSRGRPVRAHRRRGINGVLVGAVIVVALGAAALAGFLHMVRG